MNSTTLIYEPNMFVEKRLKCIEDEISNVIKKQKNMEKRLDEYFHLYNENVKKIDNLFYEMKKVSDKICKYKDEQEKIIKKNNDKCEKNITDIKTQIQQIKCDYNSKESNTDFFNEIHKIKDEHIESKERIHGEIKNMKKEIKNTEKKIQKLNFAINEAPVFYKPIDKLNVEGYSILKRIDVIEDKLFNSC